MSALYNYEQWFTSLFRLQSTSWHAAAAVLVGYLSRCRDSDKYQHRLLDPFRQQPWSTGSTAKILLPCVCGDLTASSFLPIQLLASCQSNCQYPFHHCNPTLAYTTSPPFLSWQLHHHVKYLTIQWQVRCEVHANSAIICLGYRWPDYLPTDNPRHIPHLLFQLHCFFSVSNWSFHSISQLNTCS